MAKGSLVGNIAQDLGLDLKRLKSGKARIYTGDSAEYIELNKERGVLLIKERIDREALCGQTTPCALHFQIILENPIEFYHITAEVTDINDNYPYFSKPETYFEMSESAVNGAKFYIEQAVDLDVGTNDIQSYALSSSEHFALKLHSQADGRKAVEMVLQKPLDREKEEHIALVLTAVDGGDPHLSGTSQIRIKVLDVNDNAPVFTHSVYKATVTENSPKGTVVMRVEASDADQSTNGKIDYSITNTHDGVPETFEINSQNGELRIIGVIDYEKARNYQINVRASDHGGLSDSSKIMIDVLDVNDNTPVINIMSKSAMLSEDIKPGTVVTVINTQDLDSNDNGKVQCFINENYPFALMTTTSNFFSLVTDGDLDRERDSEYNISVTCADEGVPSLSSSVTLSLQISDVNDNAPVFDKSSYEASVQENNTPGLSIFTVRARDADFNQNARVSYILEDSSVNGVPVSSLVSVSADSGVIHAVRSFDYEQIKDFPFRDQNDNAPQVLYPVQSGASVVAEIVPRSADVGYLVTKVVAVDVDSGQNAWLSYKLQKATDRALFEVGLQNGEIRTVRQVTDKDAVKQRLTVVVEDNGQPSRSATVNVNVAVADSFLKCSPTILSVKCYRWRRERMYYKSGANLPVIPYYPPLYADVGGTGTLQHVYNYEVCRTTDPRKSDLKYVRPCSESIISLDTSGAQTLTHAQREKLTSEEFHDQCR
ncbi:protocadherin beta-16-like [Xyrauchen texanus]|uniref:protocadherin beta-16-like n=1 Tax=Xyrauchen texanus TaxID=154827 RepID=UPI0022429C18|nr:protocadherin beta-16-like [Xyrauchen texanus]